MTGCFLKVKYVICEQSNIATLPPTNGLSLVQQEYIKLIESGSKGFYIVAGGKNS